MSRGPAVQYQAGASPAMSRMEARPAAAAALAPAAQRPSSAWGACALAAAARRWGAGLLEMERREGRPAGRTRQERLEVCMVRKQQRKIQKLGQGPQIYRMNAPEERTGEIWPRLRGSDEATRPLPAARPSSGTGHRNGAFWRMLQTESLIIFDSTQRAQKLEEAGPPPHTEISSARPAQHSNQPATRSPQPSGEYFECCRVGCRANLLHPATTARRSRNLRAAARHCTLRDVPPPPAATRH